MPSRRAICIEPRRLRRISRMRASAPPPAPGSPEAMAPAGARRGRVAPRTGRGGRVPLPVRGSVMQCTRRTDEPPRGEIPVSTRYGGAEKRRLDEPQGRAQRSRTRAGASPYSRGPCRSAAAVCNSASVNRCTKAASEKRPRSSRSAGATRPRALAMAPFHIPRLRALPRRRVPPMPQVFARPPRGACGREQRRRQFPSLLDPSHPLAIRQVTIRCPSRNCGSNASAALST